MQHALFLAEKINSIRDLTAYIVILPDPLRVVSYLGIIIMAPRHVSIHHTSNYVPRAAPASSMAPAPVSPPTSTTSSAPLFEAQFAGADRILTNEYAYWNPRSACPYTSAVWEMTSGTLFVKNGTGYSGVPTQESRSICDSSARTNSAVFRWDQKIVIKKKVPASLTKCADVSNGGCYYELTPETPYKQLTTPGTWHHAVITYQADSKGYVTIDEQIDGQLAVHGTDANSHGPSYKVGAVGIRGDNTEFYFKNFMVTRL